MKINLKSICKRPLITFSEIARYVRTDDPTILEIGCNDGEDTLRFLETFPKCRMFCFEPLPKAVKRFKSQVNDPRVTLIETGCSDTDGEKMWHGSHGQVPGPRSAGVPWHPDIAADWDLSGSFSEPTGHVHNPQWVDFSQDGFLPCTTLDTWMLDHPEIGAIDWVWMDVQGHERQVITGGRTVWPKVRWFYTEVHDVQLTGYKEQYRDQPGIQEILDLMPDFEFVGYYRDENVLLRNTRYAN